MPADSDQVSASHDGMRPGFGSNSLSADGNQLQRYSGSDALPAGGDSVSACADCLHNKRTCCNSLPG